MGHSSETKRQVPTCTPWAPKAKAATNWCPLAMPPAAMTGIFTALTICGTKAMVVSSPTWPPDSVPSAMIMSTPKPSMRRAKPTEGTTGMTLTPASLSLATYLAGFPAPVVTTGTCMSATNWANASLCGFISIKLTPKGLSVKDRQVSISTRIWSALRPPVAMMPKPPALLTAAAKAPVAMFAIPPCRIGFSIDKSSHIVFMVVSP